MRLDNAILCKRRKHAISIALGEGITMLHQLILYTKSEEGKRKQTQMGKENTGENVAVPLA